MYKDLKQRDKYQKDRRSRLKSEGICYVCGLEKDVADFRKSKGQINYVCKDCKNNQSRIIARKLKVECLNAYGGLECACCGETIVEFLILDHIEGNRNKHRKNLNKCGKGAHMYRWLAKNDYPEGFQTLCMNCNTAKYRFGTCSHKTQGGA